VCTSSHAVDVERLANAIYRAEGGKKAGYLYGIRSVDYDTPEEARRICINSICNNYKRWYKAGQPGDFISFMGARYCPVGADNDNGSNQYWIRNVKYFYGKS
jgi:hypothetical protein